MKSHTEYFTFHTKKTKRELVPPTPSLEGVLAKSGITEGFTLDLGTWQRVFHAALDGQRDKRLSVKPRGS